MNSENNPPAQESGSSTGLLGQRLAIVGFFLFAAFVPHSIAAAEIGLAAVGAGWLIRSIATRKLGFQRSRLDLPIALFLAWTIASSLLSAEPQISIAKLQSVCVVFLLYLTQAIVTRRSAVLLACVMILSGAAGTIYSIYDLLRGRGIVVETISNESPFQSNVIAGDAIWRVNARRVYSTSSIDEAIKTAPSGTNLTFSVISRGEHVERVGPLITDQLKQRDTPSGITGVVRSHRFRASGWTRHYETFSEILQMLAQLALGLALANLRNHGANFKFRVAIVGCVLLALGIAFTAMRTVLVAFILGAFVIVIRAAQGWTRIGVTAALMLVLAFGAFIVSQTRAEQALWLQDPSASMRLAVARVGLSRIMLHPVFGHGMDAMHRHWKEWGFPGNDMLGMHSTPLQLAFDRGLPAVLFWLWIMVTCWLVTTRAERFLRDSGDTNRHGLLLGATGAIAGFFLSSLVNYNFGDGEVALVFWWLMGVVVVLARDERIVARTSL